MKKVVTLLALLTLMFASFVFAEEVEGKLGDVSVSLEDVRTAVEAGAEEVSTPAPEWVQALSQNVFGAPEGEINMETSVIYILLFAMILIIIYSAIILIGISENKTINLVISSAVALLMTLTGATRKAMEFYLSIIKDTQRLSEIGEWTVFFWLLVVVAILVLSSKMIKKGKEKGRVERAEIRGRQTKKGMDMMRLFGKINK